MANCCFCRIVLCKGLLGVLLYLIVSFERFLSLFAVNLPPLLPMRQKPDFVMKLLFAKVFQFHMLFQSV